MKIMTDSFIFRSRCFTVGCESDEVRNTCYTSVNNIPSFKNERKNMRILKYFILSIMLSNRLYLSYFITFTFYADFTIRSGPDRHFNWALIASWRLDAQLTFTT